MKNLGFALVALLFCAPLAAQGFKFSNEDKSQEQAKADRDAKIASQLSTPCKDRIKSRKIMVLIGEEKNGVISASQSRFSAHFDAVNERLRELGLRTYTQAEIRAQIAQAEIDAYFKNDADAAMGAARKMAASYTLKGVITSNMSVNPVLKINQVVVGMNFTLAAANGKRLSRVETRDASYAGADVSGMALTLVREQAEEVVAKLYSDYCAQASGK
jgi:hypothetical protein